MYESGIDFTVLQPTMFMQTLNNSWSAVLERGQIALPYAKLVSRLSDCPPLAVTSGS
jgi:hypothetical protein